MMSPRCHRQMGPFHTASVTNHTAVVLGACAMRTLLLASCGLARCVVTFSLPCNTGHVPVCVDPPGLGWNSTRAPRLSQRLSTPRPFAKSACIWRSNVAHTLSSKLSFMLMAARVNAPVAPTYQVQASPQISPAST